MDFLNIPAQFASRQTLLLYCLTFKAVVVFRARQVFFMIPTACLGSEVHKLGMTKLFS